MLHRSWIYGILRLDAWTYQARTKGRWKYMENELLTQQEAAEYLRVSLKTLRRLVREGKLSEVRLGPRLPRYRVRDLDALVVAA